MECLPGGARKADHSDPSGSSARAGGAGRAGGAAVIMAMWPADGLYRNDSGRRLVAGRGRRWLAGWAGHGWSGGQGGQGGVGEVAGGEGFEQVVDGGGEAPFGGCFGFAADRELAEAHVVFDVAVGGFGDVAALAVGGDAFGGGQPGGHRRGGLAAGRRAGAGAAGGCFFQVPELAGGDQPVRAADGEVVLGAVPGVGEEQVNVLAGGAGGAGGGGPAAGWRRGAAGGDEGGGVFGPAQHRLEPGGAGGVLGQLGGEDQLV